MKQLSTITLLLIEDNAEVRASLQNTLNCAGYRVLIATNEEQALTYATHERIHLILLGGTFAATQGITLCVRLRRLSNLPIVILAELKHPDDLMLAFRLGANDYIVKPLPVNLLLARLAAVLRRTRTNSYRVLGRTVLPAEVVCTTPQ